MIHQIIKFSPIIKIDYFSAEESVAQVANRVERTIGKNEELTIHYGNNIQEICVSAQQSGSQVVILDSIQMMESDEVQSSNGSPAQVRAVSEYFTHWCKQHHRV